MMKLVIIPRGRSVGRALIFVGHAAHASTPTRSSEGASIK